MPKRTDIKKILVLGSGPIVIGQAAEFDYAGSQACLALKEEGYQVVLVNPNPATIMTDHALADQVYLEPLSFDYVQAIIEREKPQAILPTLGGQTALNLAKELAESGLLAAHNIELLGSNLAAIEQAEDRDAFKKLMAKLGEPVPASGIAQTLTEAETLAASIGYPVVVRPAYTLGGSGGGFAHNPAELQHIAQQGLEQSPVQQILIEQSIAGYKEIEFEVMRDQADNALIVAGMENMDPVGIHTGDSIVVTPTQTLTDRDYQMLRDAALKIIRALGVAGGVNIQMALNPQSFDYAIIEVNPRVSRSSALASKATGYPIAKLAAKVAVGYRLDELKNPINQQTWALFEPALDYVVTKMPRFPFDEFPTVDASLGTQMKATGEVMAIGRTLSESLLKAVRSLAATNSQRTWARLEAQSTQTLLAGLLPAHSDRLFALLILLKRGETVPALAAASQIDPFFLDQLQQIVEMATTLAENGPTADNLTQAKHFGFSDAQIGQLTGHAGKAIREQRLAAGIRPVFKMVDTAAGEFPSETPYFYSTYEEENESHPSGRPAVLVLGSGPIRIGQGVEFDYASVHAVKAIQAAGYEAILLNSNPETVSTDFTTADKLYFEPLTLEDVLNVIDLEQPIGVMVQFGGQTAINLAADLAAAGVRLLGTDLTNLARSEERTAFHELLAKLALAQPAAGSANDLATAKQVARQIGYPLLLRPSYVIGGQGMAIIESEAALTDYFDSAVQVGHDQPVLMDAYLQGQEAEVDVLADGQDVLIPGVLAHIERSGIHSGDSMAVYPARTLVTAAVEAQMVDAASRLAKELHIVGLLNVQFVIRDGQAYVIEVNPRASRTVPFLSKVTNIPLAQLAASVALGQSIRSLGYQPGLQPSAGYYHVKAPVFSNQKLPGLAGQLGPEMTSTGEVMGSGQSYAEALEKAFLAAGLPRLNATGTILLDLDPANQAQGQVLADKLTQLGFSVQRRTQTNNLEDNSQLSAAALVVTTRADQASEPGQQALIEHCLDQGIPYLTVLDTLAAYYQVLATQQHIHVYALGEEPA
ncbi:carbamoyl-phosphate synthase large subunit [Leuconostocaceae bacterium ESL0958]|nr:carbamoyl-phosphate synthase large subunit [Leuconostocaceae bacterium ESL0958]